MAGIPPQNPRTPHRPSCGTPPPQRSHKVTRMDYELPLEARARQMMEKFRTHEWLGFAAGFLIFAVADILRARFAPQLPVWMVRGCFFPLVVVASVAALYLSMSMHKALKEHSVVDPLARREMCLLFLLGSKDQHGLRLMRRIAMAANVHALSFGMALGLLVFSLVGF